MRRPAAVVVGLFLGTVLMVGAKLGARTPHDVGVAVTGPPEVSPSGSPSVAASAPPSPTARRSAAPSATGSAVPTTGPPDKTEPPSGGSELRTGTFSGGTVQYRYGTLQVAIVVSGGRITDVRADHHGTSRTSEEINAEALPKLRREALAAQSAQIDTVSGATYTSEAYRTSLQSAIDKAG